MSNNVFNIVDGKLFNNNTKSLTPEWINDIKFTKPIKHSLTLDSNSDIINSKHVLAQRDNSTAHVRDMKMSFNDKTLQQYSLSKLSSFLRHQRYEANASVDNNVITIDVNFCNNPFQYTFKYIEKDGKVDNEKTFSTKIGSLVQQYPFSIAGLEDSFNDIKNIDSKTPFKTKTAVYQYSTISRYEIVKRCNNSLSKAKEMIDKYLKSDDIVAIGSNEYASTSDVNYLFPDISDKYQKEASHAFDYVDNQVSTNIMEKKSANKLATDAYNIINGIFNIHKLTSASRDNDELLVTAEIIHNDIRDSYSFNFSINDEHLDTLNYIENDKYERYTAAQLLDKFGENDNKVLSFLKNNNKHIADGYVYSLKTIHSSLDSIMERKVIDEMMQKLTDTNKVSKLNSTTYASKYSLNELVNMSNVTLRNDDDIDYIKVAKCKFGNDNRFYSYKTNDNDTRNHALIVEANDKVDNVYNFINQYFTNYSLKSLIHNKAVIAFKSDYKNRDICANIEFDDSHNVRNITCSFMGKNIDLKTLSKAFSQSRLLKAYLADNKVNNVSGKQIYSFNAFNKLENLVDKKSIDDIIASLEKSGKITRISKLSYASKYSFDELLNFCNVNIDKNFKNEMLENKNVMKDKRLVADYIDDADTRNVDNKITKADFQSSFLYYAPKHFANISFNKIAINKDNSIDANVSYFNSTLGIKQTANIHYTSIDNIENENKQLLLNELNASTTTAVKTFNRFNTLANHDGKHIFTISDIKSKLKNIIDVSNIDNVMNMLCSRGYITRIASDKYASKLSLSEIINHSKLQAYDNETIKSKLSKSRISANLIPQKIHVSDCDSKSLNNIHDGKTNDAFNNVKHDIIKMAQKACDDYKITKNKLQIITKSINNVNDNIALNAIYTDLQRYL